MSQFGTERLKAVVSVDQTPKMINEGDWLNGMYGLNPETRPTFFDDPIPAPNRLPISKGLLLYLMLHKKYCPAFDQARTKALLLDHADADWRDTIAVTDVPALYIAGGDSPFWPPAHAMEMAALAPKGRASIVPRSGHAVNRGILSCRAKGVNTMPTRKYKTDPAQLLAEGQQIVHCVSDAKYRHKVEIVITSAIK